MLQRLIVDDTHEFEFLGNVSHGLTPRMSVNLYAQLNDLIQNFMGADHPIIIRSIVDTIMFSLDSAIYALFRVRDRNTFTAVEIKTYLYNHLEWLLDVERHFPSLLGKYITVNRH